MKKMKSKLTIARIICSMCLILSCSIEDGRDGAIGPQGEQGLPGLDGSVKVMYSDWLTSSHQPGISSSRILPIDESHELNWEKDVVLVYGKRTDLAAAILLPFSNLDDHENYHVHFGLEFQALPVIQVRATSTDGLPKSYTFFSHYRYVIIPSVVTDPLGKASNAIDFTKLTYDEVNSRFDIPK